MSADPSSPELYEYQPLNAHEIRLLRLRRREGILRHDICTFNLDNIPRYVALSYTWGAPSPTFGFAVNGNKSLRIRQSLHNFFQVYHNDDLYEEEYMWVDQLCINQSSIEERNHQVSMLSSIYRGASHVLAWQQLQHWMNVLPGLDLGTHTEGDPTSASKAVKKLLQDTYFSRLWVVQETMLAREVYVVIGNGRISFEQLRKAWALATGESVNIFRDTRTFNSLSTDEFPPFTLQKCIKLFCQENCEDPRDKVYGLMGLVHEDERLEIDYLKSTYEVYSDVVTAICSSYIRHLTSLHKRKMRIGREYMRLQSVRLSVECTDSEWVDGI
jgi:hypothetical protein